MTEYRRVPVGDGLARLIASGMLTANTRVWEGLADDGGTLRVLRSIEPEGDGWSRHLSISHTPADGPRRYPSWDEQKEACWTFVPGVRLFSIMPAQTETFVNVHDTTFHWWENP